MKTVLHLLCNIETRKLHKNIHLSDRYLRLIKTNNFEMYSGTRSMSYPKTSVNLEVPQCWIKQSIYVILHAVHQASITYSGNMYQQGGSEVTMCHPTLLLQSSAIKYSHSGQFNSHGLHVELYIGELHYTYITDYGERKNVI